MIKLTKFIYRLSLFILPLFLFINLSKSIVSSTNGGSHWGNWSPTTSCAPSASCGTTAGTQTVTRTCLPGGFGYDCQLSSEQCDEACPQVTWSTSRTICVRQHKGRCSEYSTETFGPITFTYNKSNDPHKCHRPTPSSLELPSWTIDDFNHDNSEHRSTVKTNCVQIPAQSQTNVVSCAVPFVPCVTPSVTSTPYPTDTPTTTPTVTSTPEVTPSEQPTSSPTSSPNVGGDNGGSSNPPDRNCYDQSPSAPTNLRATALGGGQVRLNWDPVSGPVTNYVVGYGPSMGNYPYGDPNVGNVTSYIVKSLNPGGNYCFYVQSQNGCAGGPQSNVVCTNQPQQNSFRVLGATDNYNPLVTGIKNSYGGEVLGTSTELMATAEVSYSNSKLPSGNIKDLAHSISIPKLNISTNVYQPQKIGDEYTVGHREILTDNIGGNQVYYGHNGTDIFGKLYQIKKGDSITITQNGLSTVYSVDELQFVHKSQVDSLVSGAGQIVLTTCSYTQPDYRIVVKASIK